ncbi:n-acetylglutamate synthase [Metabacillus sp. HB246100]
MLNYYNKIFVAKSNTENGEVSSDTIFTYKQEGNILSGTYSGGEIVKGHLIGIVKENHSLQFNYHHLNKENKIRCGSCHSIPEILSDGRVRLHEKWKWLDSEQGEGESIVEEVKELLERS